MLPPDYLEGLESQIANIYGDLEIDIIREISKRIANVGYANTVVQNEVIIAQQAGVLYSDIVTLVSERTGKTYKQIEKIFYEAGIKALESDDDIYKKHGLNPLPLKQDKSMLDFLTSTIKTTNRNLENLSRTTATSTQQKFIEAMNKTYLEVSTGVKSYSQAVIDAIDDLANTGTKVIYPSGYTTSLENAVRMNIRTSVNSNCGTLQLMRAKEMGTNLMEISAHGGARPEHAEWQGKIVDITGKNRKYLNLDDIGYRTATGFQGVNCGHTWFPYFEGDISAYSKSELKKLENETIMYNGKKVSVYEATQLQRKMEREIRVDKKKIAGREKLLSSITTDNTEKELNAGLNYYKAKLEMDKNNLNDFIKETQLKKQYERVKISQKGNFTTKKVVNYAEKLYNKGSKFENLQDFLNDETIRKNIRSNNNYKKIKESKQLIHLINNENYIEGRSYFEDADIDKLEKYIKKYSGTGRIIRKISDNSFNNQEIVIIKELNGVNINMTTKNETITHRFKIHYSNKGTHIVPTFEESE